MRLLVTCVSPDRPHPSGRLALMQEQDGVDVHTLFEDSRSVVSLIKDTLRLIAILNGAAYDQAQINVNGSIAQAVTVVICRWFGLKTTLWIMDSYPGCLRYVTRLWPLLYPFFFIGSVIAKLFAHHVLIIDEAFAKHSPTWQGFRHKCVYTPLPQEEISMDLTPTVHVPTIGILGNIEASWMVNDFQNLYSQARDNGYRLLIATSLAIDTSYFSADGITVLIPWPKTQTEHVFSQCSAILVPLSIARLIYSSPSKIIDCYLRGIQPVVMTDKHAWDANCDRAIYRKCVHISEFFAEKKRYTSQELLAYSHAWRSAQTVPVSMVAENESILVATEKELVSVSAIHMDAFPGFFLTTLGPAFVRTMYKAFLINRNSIFLLHADGKSINGFVVGTFVSTESATDRHLAMKLLPQFVWAVIPAVLRNPVRVLTRVVRQFIANEVAPSIPHGAAVLRSIGVAPAMRGTGIAGHLLRAFERHAHVLGASCVALTTDVLDNERAINFYRKHGYQIAQEFRQDKRRSMYLMLKELR